MSVGSNYYRRAVSQYFTPPPAPTFTSQQMVAQEEKKPNKKDKGTVDKLFGGIGKVVDVGGDILDLSGKYVARPALGAATKAMAMDNRVGEALRDSVDLYRNSPGIDLGPVTVRALDITPAGIGGRFMDKLAPESEEERQEILEAASFTDAWQKRGEHLSLGEQLLMEIAADPTTWITAGSVGTVAKLPRIASLAEKFPAVATALRNAEQAAGLAERVQALPLTAPFAAVRGTAKGASKVLPRTGREILHPITGEVLGRGLLDQTPKSVLQESGNDINAAVRSAIGRGAKTRGVREPGEFGFSEVGGIDSLYGSNALVGSRRTLTELESLPATQMTRRLNNMGISEIADLYNATPLSSPVRGELERIMGRRGLLNTTMTAGPPGGFGTARTTSLNQPRIDQARLIRDMNLNTPGMQNARPHISGDLDVDYENVMRFVRSDVGLPINAQTPVEPFVKSKVTQMLKDNPNTANMQAMWANDSVRADLARAITAGSEKEAARHLQSAFFRVNAKQSARGLVHPVVTGILDKFIPTIEKTRDNLNLPAMNRFAINNSVVDDTQMDALAALANDDGFKQMQKRWEKAGDEMEQLFRSTPGAGEFTDRTTAADFKDVYHLFSPQDQKKVDAYLKQWKLDEASFDGTRSLGNRLSKIAGHRDFKTYSVADAYADNVTDAWVNSTAKQMGITNTRVEPSLLGKLSWVPRAWREQALISPRYPIVNAIDMGVKTVLNGVNPISSRGSDKFAKDIGLGAVPRNVFVGGEVMDLGNIGSEFMNPSQSSALPGPLGWVSKINRGFSRGMENTFREWAWGNAAKDVLHEYKPLLHNRIKEVGVRDADGLIADLEQTGTYRMVAGVRTNISRDNGIKFTPNTLHQLARSHGASNEQANLLAREWQSATQQASDAGVNLSNKVHFDFDKTYNIEDKLFLKKIMPFHFFATRNFPGYAEMLANRPEVVNAWMAYNNASEQDRIEMGLPDRFEGMVPIGDGFLDSILGPNKVFFNPMSALSFVDQTKGVGQATADNEYTEPAKLLSRKGIGGLIDRSGKLGLGGPAPWIQIPLSIVGLTEEGAKDETMPILRHSGITQATLGTDLGEGVARGFIDDARAMFHNGERVETHTGSQFRDNQIVTKLQETMQSYIDAGNDPTAVRDLFVQASKDGPGNQLWDQAAEEVQGEQGKRDWRNFFFPFPTKDISEQGIRLNTARESMPDGLLDNDKVVDMMKYFGDPAVANRGFRRPSLVDRQGDPIFIDRNTGKRETQADRDAQKDMWGGDNWGPDHPYPYNSQVVYSLWTQYKAGLSDPSKARVSDFFNVYNIPGR